MTISGMYSVAGMPNFANMTVGNVYFIGRPSSPTQFDMWARKFGKTRYADGSWCFHRDPSTGASTAAGDGTGIQEAITGSTGGMNNYFFVAPGGYTQAAAITMASKSSSHLLAVNGDGYDVGAMGAAALTQGGAFTNITMGTYCELAGFQIINKSAYPAVTVGDGVWRCNIRNNYFHMTQGAAASIIVTAGSGLSYGRIANNAFSTWVGGALTAAIYLVGATACQVERNIITNYSGTMDFGIEFGSSAQAIASNNIISDCGGAGTITVAISLGTSGTAFDNKLAVLSGRGFTGGTPNRSFVQNFDATSGGATPIET